MRSCKGEAVATAVAPAFRPAAPALMPAGSPECAHANLIGIKFVPVSRAGLTHVKPPPQGACAPRRFAPRVRMLSRTSTSTLTRRGSPSSTARLKSQPSRHGRRAT